MTRRRPLPPDLAQPLLPRLGRARGGGDALPAASARPHVAGTRSALRRTGRAIGTDRRSRRGVGAHRSHRRESPARIHRLRAGVRTRTRAGPVHQPRDGAGLASAVLCPDTLTCLRCTSRRTAPQARPAARKSSGTDFARDHGRGTITRRALRAPGTSVAPDGDAVAARRPRGRRRFPDQSAPSPDEHLRPAQGGRRDGRRPRWHTRDGTGASAHRRRVARRVATSTCPAPGRAAGTALQHGIFTPSGRLIARLDLAFPTIWSRSSTTVAGTRRVRSSSRGTRIAGMRFALPGGSTCASSTTTCDRIPRWPSER